MSSAAIKCPNCGADRVKTVKADTYQCIYCGSQFNMVRPDVRKTDYVSHNCPMCGKPVQAGSGFVCVNCGKDDLCPDCVSRMSNGYWCSDCLKSQGKACFLCGKLAIHVCGSCKDRSEKGLLGPDDLVIQTCDEHHLEFFTDYHREQRGGGVPRWSKISFTCPQCGEICNQCVEYKKGFLSSDYICKNCGSKVNTQEVEM